MIRRDRVLQDLSIDYWVRLWCLAGERRRVRCLRYSLKSSAVCDTRKVTPRRACRGKWYNRQKHVCVRCTDVCCNMLQSLVLFRRTRRSVGDGNPWQQRSVACYVSYLILRFFCPNPCKHKNAHAERSCSLQLAV